MIIRDSKESVQGNAQNARQRLGQLIEHYMTERNVDDRRVARTCSCSPHDVEQWRSGAVVPSPDQWSKLKRSIHHAFAHYNEVYQRARTEADDEARARAKANTQPPEQPKEIKEAMRPTTKINSIADKLNAALVAQTPIVPISIVRDPDPDSAPSGNTVQVSARTPRTAAPPGSYGAVAISKRAEFVRNLIRQRPNIRTTDRDSIVELVRTTFGVGISPVAIEEIRAEVAAECRSPNTHDNKPASTPVVAEAVAREVAAVSVEAQASRDHEADINTAVGLILESIPNLQTFTINIDESGEASVDYQIRKVKIETIGGSFKVKR